MSFHPYRAAAAVLAVFCGSAAAGPPAKYALLIAVDKYQHDSLQTLKFAELDARAFADLFRASGYKVDELAGREATAANIRKFLDRFASVGDRDGVVVVGMFGHGIQPGETSYFVPYDARLRPQKDAQGRRLFDGNAQPTLQLDEESLVSIKEVLSALSLSPATNRVLLADCCRNDPNAARDIGFGSKLTVDSIGKVNCSVLLACDRGQRAYEHADWGHGAFTLGMLDGIARAKKLNRPATMGFLLDEVAPRVTAMVKKTIGKEFEQTVRPFFTASADLQLTKPPEPPVPVPPPSPGGEVHFEVARKYVVTKTIGPGILYEDEAGFVSRDQSYTIAGDEIVEVTSIAEKRLRISVSGGRRSGWLDRETARKTLSQQ